MEWVTSLNTARYKTKFSRGNPPPWTIISLFFFPLWFDIFWFISGTNILKDFRYHIYIPYYSKTRKSLFFLQLLKDLLTFLLILSKCINSSVLSSSQGSPLSKGLSPPTSLSRLCPYPINLSLVTWLICTNNVLAK